MNIYAPQQKKETSVKHKHTCDFFLYNPLFIIFFFFCMLLPTPTVSVARRRMV